MQDKQLTPINTYYKGSYFRSRLEARWAIYFDSLGIQWEYEFKGFYLDGIRYLPDFWLPTFDGGMYVEVKPQELTDFEYEKAARLAKASKKGVWLAIGTPSARQYRVLQSCTEGEIYESPAIPLLDDSHNKNKMFYCPIEYVDSKGVLADDSGIPYPFDSKCTYNNILMAVNAARAARFERNQ